MQKITFVLTSCGRVELLNKTLESFFKFNDYKLEKMYVVEDYVDQNVYEDIKKKWGKNNTSFNEKKGQIKSIVETYKLVNTPLIFHCEDDWVYTKKKLYPRLFKDYG